jgi:hypothetical protein
MHKAITISKFCIVFLLVTSAATWIQTYYPHSILLANAASPNSSSDVSSSASNLTGPAENFSVVWITDTQYLSESYPTYFDSLCRWIVNNAGTYNVKMVVHTGDLVDTEGNLTQWANPNNSMSILLDAGIPYCWDAGNHDYNATCWVGNQFAAFNTSVMQQKPYWVGDDFDGQNTAVHFSDAGQDFLIVNIAYNASDEVLTWANNILDAYPNSHAIAATHFYVNRTGGYESWAANFQSKVLETHPNVFLTLSAHVYPLAYSGLRTQVGDRQELVFNRQDKDNELGAASLRILTFDVAGGTVDVKTYVLYANDFLDDSNNQFTLNTTFHNDAAQNVPEFPTGVSLVLVVLFGSIVVICVFKRRLGRTAHVFLR